MKPSKNLECLNLYWSNFNTKLYYEYLKQKQFGDINTGDSSTRGQKPNLSTRLKRFKKPTDRRWA